jgi:hypothetical protein
MSVEEEYQHYMYIEAYQDLIEYKIATPPYKMLADAYGRELDQPHEQEYRREKLFIMSSNFLLWMRTLDRTNFRRLTAAIQAHSYKDDSPPKLRSYPVITKRIACINHVQLTDNEE